MPRRGKEPGDSEFQVQLCPVPLTLHWYLSEPQLAHVSNEGRWSVGFFQPLNNAGDSNEHLPGTSLGSGSGAPCSPRLVFFRLSDR